MSAAIAPTRRLLSIPQAAEELGVAPATVRRWMADGTLESVKLGGRRMVEPYAIDRLIAAGRGDDVELPERPAPVDDDPVVAMAEMIGLSPRVAGLRPELTDRFEVVSPGEHLARFARTFCRHTQQVPEGPRPGSPFELEVFQREILDEGLDVGPDGRRLYQTIGLIEPRKNGKTAKSGVLSLYLASPADGEHRPVVIQAAGSKGQAGELFDHTVAFIDDPLYGSPELRRLFLPQQTMILCPSIGGKIERVAGDGDLNHSKNPHAVVADELHVWKTPKQRENWKALTTAQGGRVDPLVVFLTTEGDGDEDELALLVDRIEKHPATEIERPRPCLTVYRNRDAKMLVYRYAVPARATIDDLDAFEAANPAPWRTRERIRLDLADPKTDEPTKMRLYGNKRGGSIHRWISEDRWAECLVPELARPAGVALAIGGDGARTRDTTAIGWAWECDDGRIGVGCRVWTTRPDVPNHVFVPGGRLDNDLARDFVRDELVPQFQVVGFLYDERYLDTQAHDLSEEDGLRVIEMHQGKPEMVSAWDEFYALIHEGEIPGIAHDGCPVLAAHVAAATGVKTERGWKVSKIRAAKPIDALAAVVMAVKGLDPKLFPVAEPWAAAW